MANRHAFQCIYIRGAPREVLKTETFGHAFQHLPQHPVNVNAHKTIV